MRWWPPFARQAGDYASQDDAVQDAIRHWAHERSASAVNSISQLSALLQESPKVDKEYLDFDEVFDQLQAKYDALAESERS